jgi:[ribosomal protein S5]-alanine N-acetyltransferase
MKKGKLAVREIEEGDFNDIIDYFLNADKEFLFGMGVDTQKLPSRVEWWKLLKEDFSQCLEQKKFFFIIWLIDDMPIGHSNINKIIMGEEAYMHLHLWYTQTRKKGIGFELLRLTLPIYFDLFKLKNIFSEPYAFNPAPNKVLFKSGFDFVKQYETIPGWINFHQKVNRWSMSHEKFQSLQTDINVS